MPCRPFSKTWAGLYNLKGQIIIACTNAVCVRVSVCARRWLWLIFNPFLLFQLSCEAHCLRSISYCKLIIFCWNCISVCVCICVCLSVCSACIYFVIASKMTWHSIISHLPYPDLTRVFFVVVVECISSTAAANASPVSITFLWIWKTESRRWREEGGGRGGGYKVATPHSQLLVKKIIIIKIQKS